MPVSSAFAGACAIVRDPLLLPASTSLRCAIERVRTLRAAPVESGPRPAEFPRQFHQQQRARAIVVTDGDRAIAVVTEASLLDAALDSPEVVLGELCAPEPLVFEIDAIAELTDLNETFQALTSAGGFAIVTEGDRPVGLLSEASLLDAMRHLEASRWRQRLATTIAPGAQAWQASEERYRALLDAREAVLVVDLDGYAIDANRSAEVLFGYGREALLGLHHTELYPPEERPAMAERFERLLAGLVGDAPIAQQTRCRDGRIEYVEICEKALEIDGTTLVQLVFYDVTERYWQENTLRQVFEATSSSIGQSFFEALVAALASALAVDSVFLMEADSNTTMRLVAGWSRGQSQVRGETFAIAHTPCGRVRQVGSFVRERGVRAAFSGQLVADLEIESYVGVAFYDEGGQICGHLCVFERRPLPNTEQIRSILNVFAARAGAELERQRAQEMLALLNRKLEAQVVERTAELQARQDFLQTVIDLELFPLAISWKDSNSVYLGCNRKFAEDAGLDSIEEIVGKTDAELPWGSQAETYRRADRQTIASNKPKLGSIETFVRADGHSPWIEISKVPLHDLDGNAIGILVMYRDITAQRQAEAERQQLVTRLDVAVKSAGLGIWDWDLANDELVWDERMYAIYGLEPREGCNTCEQWKRCLHPSDVAMATDYLDYILQTNEDYKLVFRIIRPDGEVREIDARAIVQRDANGKPLRMTGVNVDITERRETDRLLERQLATIEAAAEGLAIVRGQILTYVNSAFARMFGHRSAASLIGQSWQPLYAEETIEVLRQPVLASLQQSGTWKGETIARRSDGTNFSEELSLTRAEDGSIICVCRDISERKQAEAALQQSEARWKFALEGAGDGVWDWNLKADRIFFSHQWKSTLGYDDGEIGDRPHEWTSRIHPDDRPHCQAALTAHFNGEMSVYTSEYRIRCKDGQYKWVLDRGQAIERQANGRPLRTIGLQSDITARKLAEQQLRDSKESAELADRAKSNFLALMSHELRTPLNGMLGLATLLSQTNLKPQQHTYVNTLRDTAASLSQIVNDILDFSKLQADKLQLDTIEFDPRETIARLEALLVPKAEEKQLDLCFETEAALPSMLAGDPLRLSQVLLNLIGNAIKFTESGSITVAIAERTRDAERIRLNFSVCDTGIGLSERQIQSLFDPFTQVDPSPSRRYGGTGLGLTICQRLIESMGGKISVRSEVGRGSTFDFELPFAYRAASVVKLGPHPDRADDRSAPVEVASSDSGGPRDTNDLADTSLLKGASVLLVEDNEVNQLIARQILRQLGMQVSVAADGRKAIAQAVNQPFDAILMDVQMPGLDGHETTRRLRRLAQLGTDSTRHLAHIPIVAMTAHAFESDKARSLESGMNDHLTKPIDTRTLATTLAYWLDRNDPATSPVALPVADLALGVRESRRELHRELQSDPAMPPTRSPESATAKTPNSTPKPLVAGRNSPPAAPPASLPGLDLEQGLERISHDTELYAELLEMFSEIYTPFHRTLNEAVDRGDRDEIIHLLHTLKGSAGNIAATSLRHGAARIVDRLRQEEKNQPVKIDPVEVSSLLHCLDRVLESIDRYAHDFVGVS